jgi:hypothetical protein
MRLYEELFQRRRERRGGGVSCGMVVSLIVKYSM